MADDPNTVSTSTLAGPISPLRQRMIEDMTIRRLAPRTQATYLSAVSRFSRHFGRSPGWCQTYANQSRQRPDTLAFGRLQWCEFPINGTVSRQP